jgi:SAM-dependent methyltransferase
VTIDEQKLEAFVHQAVGDMGVAISGALVHIGDKLGLYKAMAGAGPLTPADLAGRTDTTERYVREWLDNQAAGGYVTYDPTTARYELPDEHAMVLADENSPVFLGGGYEVVTAGYLGEAKVTEAFRTGGGVAGHEHDERLFRGTERFFRPGYQANLVDSWLPALEGAVDALSAGASVADIGCGFGAATIVLAKAFPRSRFVGYDNHDVSIAAARKAAAQAGVADRVTFEVAAAADYPGTGYDLVTVFDALHDMGDPVGVARHVRSTLSPDGTWLVVEPYASDHVPDNHNPLGRAFYGFSTLFCTPGSLAQDVALGLGAQAGGTRLRQVLTDGGFTRVRQAAATPLNLILEARP